MKSGTDEVGHGIAAELAQVRRHQRGNQHVATGPADHEGKIAVTTEVDTACHGDERGAGHPVCGRCHTIEQRRDLAAGDVVGVDLHGSGQPANGRIDNDGKCDEQDADGFGADTHLFEYRHQRDEAQEASRVKAIDFWQIIDKRSFHLFFLRHAAFDINLVLQMREHENKNHECELGTLGGHIEPERKAQKGHPIQGIGKPVHNEREEEPD